MGDISYDPYNMFKKQKYSLSPPNTFTSAPVVPATNAFNWSAGSGVDSLSSTGLTIPGVTNLSQGFQSNPLSVMGSTSFSAPPTTDFNWGGLVDPKGTGGFLMDVAKTGTGIYSAWMGQKNQKFLQDYYGKQMDLQQKNYTNTVSDTNRQLSNQAETRLGNQGIMRGTAEFDKGVTDYMKKWGIA